MNTFKFSKLGIKNFFQNSFKKYSPKISEHLKQNKAKILSTFTLSYLFFNYEKFFSKNKKAHSCGIIGYLGKDPNAIDVCVEGIQLLQFRGYDSAGICTINSNNEFEITKHSSIFSSGKEGDCITMLVEEVPKIHQPSTVGIGHTRWATHGKKNSINAHPHLDFSNRIALVHNGIIDNYKELKDDLINNKKITLNSETDTEVIVQLIGYYYNQGLNLKDAISKTLNQDLVGSYALVILNKDEPNKLYCARNGSPLVIGTGENFYIVSSDVAAFQKYTTNYILIDNQQILEVNLDMKIEETKIKKTQLENIYLKPTAPYEHFMIQEIFEQPDTVNRAMNYGSRIVTISNQICGVKLGGLEKYANFLKLSKNLLIVACGTSYFASMFVSNLMRKLDIFNSVQIVDGAEFSKDYIPKENPVLIFVSQSGETYDVLRPLEIAKNEGVMCIGIVNKVESTLARSVLCGVFVNAGREISVASTKAFSGQVVALILTTLFFAQSKNEMCYLNPIYEESINFLKGIPYKLKESLPKFQEKAKEIAKVLAKHDNMFVLGKGYGEAIAKEISLKIKEVSYIHAEGYNAGTFKHGPMAMIDPLKRTPIIILVLKDNFYEDMISNYQQIKARNATVVLLTNCRSSLDIENIDFIVDLPNEGLMSSFYGNFVGQLIAYYISVERGYNPDKPRNLSKELTTK